MTASARVRQPLRRVALLLASLAIALAAAELLARAFAPEWLRARMREVAVGRSLADWSSDADWPVERDEGRPVRFVPGRRFTVRHDEYLHSVQIDEYGGRASGRAADDGRRIVPVFGDSMSFGLGVRDEETWVSLIGRLLPMRLVNLAIPGSDMVRQLDALDRLDASLGAPSACVFVVFLGNDLSEIASMPEPEPDHGVPATLSAWFASRLFAANRTLDEHWMLRRWSVVQWARALAVRAANASRRDPQVEPVFTIMDRGTPLDPTRRAFAQAVDRLVAAAVRFRFTPVVVVIPDRFQVDERIRRDKAALYGVPLSSYDPRQPNRLVAETLAARGIAFIDTTGCLEGRAGQYYVRDMHLRAAGHETVARCVGAFLAGRVTDASR